jgi:hypothetical protein
MIVRKNLLCFALSLLLAACASGPKAPASDNLVSPNFQVPQAKSLIVLLPAEIEVEDLQPGAAMMMNALHQRLTAAGYRVVALDRASHDTIWSQEVQEVGGIFDPGTGAVRQRELNMAMGHLVQRVCAETQGTMIIRPRMVLRQAELSGMSASWDGQQRRVPVFGGDTTSYKGSTFGLSVALDGFASNGEMVMRTYGGALLPYRVNINSGKSEVRADLFANDTEVSEGVAIALVPFFKL